MDILDIILRREVHNLALQGGVVKLLNAARCRADVQFRLIVGVRHIARQVDAAAAGVGALDVYLAHIRANQPNINRLGRVHGVVVELNSFSSDFPPIPGMFEPAEEAATPFLVRPVFNL